MADSTGSFADQLRRLRESAGLSQYALAKMSGLTKQALSRLERGEREPTWGTVQLLASALGVGCQEFVDPGLQAPADAADDLRPRGRPRKAPAAEASPTATGGKTLKAEADQGDAKKRKRAADQGEAEGKKPKGKRKGE